VANRTPALSARQIRIIAKALADPRRFDILKHIAAQETCLGCADLLAAFPITPATLSHHLKELEAASLIETHREGKFLRAQFLRSTWDAYLAALQKI
jgi:ArsR family transcriptional regulator, arsenate/arsenite/antimonite-responsive transcriptional repressor